MRDPHPIRVAHVVGSSFPHLVPLYRLLANDPRIELTVFFASSGGVRPAEIGHGQPIAWDSDLLAGYRSVFVARADHNPVDGGPRSNFLMYRDLDIVPKLVRGRFEVVWVFGYSYLTHMLAAASTLVRSRPLLVQTDQTLLPVARPAWKQGLKAVLLPIMMKHAYGLYVGTESRRWMLRYGIRPDHLFFAPYSTVDADMPLLDVQRPDTESRARLGLTPDSGPVILTVSRLIPKKNPMLLLRAFATVRDAYACTLVFVGSGELEAELRRSAQELGVRDVLFLGFLNRSQLRSAYSAADIFVLASSHRETWGTVVNEAMQSGLPVVVTDQVGSAVDLVIPDQNGFIIQNGDEAQLVRSLGALVADPELRRRFGKRSFEIVTPRTHLAAAGGVMSAIEAAVGPERWKNASRASYRTTGGRDESV